MLAPGSMQPWKAQKNRVPREGLPPRNAHSRLKAAFARCVMIEPTQVEALLDEAVLKSPAERAVFLDHACRGNRELRQEVERLLAAHPQAEGFLDRPALPDTAAHGLHAETAGTII